MKFIVLGDLHYTDYETEAERATRDHFYETLFQRVAAEAADRVFAIGDLVHFGQHNELQGLFELAQRSGIQINAVTGNHDTGTLLKNELRPYFVEGKSTAAELYHAFSQDGIRFVMLDTSRELLADIDWSGFVSPEQLAWLTEEVHQFRQGHTGDQTLVVMGHHPIYGTTALSTKDKLNIANSDEVQQAFGTFQPGKALYFCGHNHVNSLAGPDRHGWLYVQCGAPLVALSFRVITINADQIEIDTVDISTDLTAIKNTLTPIYEGLEHFSDVPLEKAGGTALDRTLFLETRN